jgi:hypothetical protein
MVMGVVRLGLLRVKFPRALVVSVVFSVGFTCLLLVLRYFGLDGGWVEPPYERFGYQWFLYFLG